MFPMKKRGLLVVVSSPSGGGKGTILKELFRRNENLKMVRFPPPRAPRARGRNTACTITSSQKTSSKRTSKTMQMLEYAEYCDNFYGTPKAAG